LKRVCGGRARPRVRARDAVDENGRARGRPVVTEPAPARRPVSKRRKKKDQRGFRIAHSVRRASFLPRARARDRPREPPTIAMGARDAMKNEIVPHPLVALVARVALLALNLVLFGLGVTLLVMSTRHGHYSSLINDVYQHGGLTVAAFEEPDSALLLAGLFITFISVQVRGRAVRARPPAPRRVIILATLLQSTPE